MQKKNLLLSCVVALTSLSLVMAGCSSNNSSDSKDNATASANKGANAEANKEANTEANSGANSSADTTNNNAPAADQAEPIKAQFYYDFAALTKYITDVNPIVQASDNVTFEGVPYTDTTAYQTAVRIGFTTQEAPDLFKWWNGYKLKELADSGNLADMTEQWNELTADENGILPSLSGPLTVDGKIYGIPASAHYWTIFYNKKVFADNGLTVPTTWDEFIKINDTLKAKDITPIGTSIKDSWNGFIWFEDLMIHSYPEVYKKLVVGQAKYTDPEVVEVMELWKSMYDKGYFSKPMTMDTEIPPAFAKGKIGMFLCGTWYESFLTGAGLKPEEGYGSFIMPAIKPEAGKTVISEITPFLVSKNAKNKEGAIKAALALTKKEANEKLLAVFGGVPTRKDVEASSPTIKALVDNISKDNYAAITRYWEATPSELSEYGSSEFIRFMLNPDQYMDVLNNIQKKADKYWAENK
ncbi:ABC transporter substrate-binding protein [Paenibacillus sp. OV219]|uniref:ABC transporter substrate-binding protein n=1 Tax=Paenibacillus sp. OV219 TaxID=1884377 RepID=UPI0008B8A221|nr:extracellular solute-binding protein [Paenibacillus sp. OV219]SEO89039.1 carbohydrate ABC transporter substrate-binding protein, CUT1 family [Paenibacillus sp. OV219]